jgi:DNA-binding GntR family transcriptional regulator
VPNVQRPEPPYMQVTRHYRELILSGAMAEGDLMPSARKIVSEWKIAHATAAKVLSTLRSEGLVEGKPGIGTVVTGRTRHRSAQDRLTAISRTGLIYPPGHFARIRSAELITAPDYVAEALDLPSGSTVIRRQRTTFNADELPESTSISWFDGALIEACPDLVVPERIRKGTVHYIAEQTGRQLQNGRDGVSAASASTEVAEVLRIDIGAPVLLGRNWWTDSSGWVAEFGESISPEGRWIYYDYEIASGQ